jgi:anti-sigma factor RsiW
MTVQTVSPACSKNRSFFSAYIDGAVSGQQMQEIARHLEGCVECNREFEAMRTLQRSLTELGPIKPPADLGLRLRLAISHEHAQSKSNWFDTLSVKWDNAIRPMLMQVSAGFAGAVVMIGGVALLLGMVAAPEPVMANDEPLGALTAPHYVSSVLDPRAIVTSQDSMIVVEAYVNSQGRVYDYNIVSGPDDPAVKSQVVDQLLLRVYEPASAFGAPVRGRVLVSFSGVSVHS